MVRSVDLSTRLQQAWQEWTEAVAGLNDHDYDSPNVYPHWNLKDVMGHVFSYQLLMLKTRPGVPKAQTFGVAACAVVCLL